MALDQAGELGVAHSLGDVESRYPPDGPGIDVGAGPDQEFEDPSVHPVPQPVPGAIERGSELTSRGLCLRKKDADDGRPSGLIRGTRIGARLKKPLDLFPPAFERGPVNWRSAADIADGPRWTAGCLPGQVAAYLRHPPVELRL